jgi:hypothetical protein
MPFDAADPPPWTLPYAQRGDQLGSGLDSDSRREVEF